MDALVEWTGALRKGFTLPVIPPGCPLPKAITIVLGVVSDHLMQSKAVRTWLTAIPKGHDTFCPDSPVDELVNYVATQRGRVDKSNPRLNLEFIRRVIFPVLAFEREQLLIACAQLNDVSQAERELMHLSTRLAPALDELWVCWYRRMCIPFQSLIESEREYCTTALKELLPQFDYSVYDWARDRVLNRRSWAEAFPAKIKVITNILENSICSDATIAAYLAALHRAYACKQLGQLETLWAAVDQAWIRISGQTRIFPVHGMENGYEHPHCISPEFRLIIRTPLYSELIEEVRVDTLAYAEGPYGLSESSVELLRARLGLLDIAAFEDVARGGCCANFKIGGQVAPNRQDILAVGGKVSLSLAGNEQMVPLYKQVLRDNCPPAVARRLVPHVTLDKMILHACVHELWHPAGRSAETDSALGSLQGLLEEAKATHGGLIARNWKINTPKHRIELFTIMLARIFRFTHQTVMENHAAAHYVTEQLVAAQTMHEAGLIGFSQTGKFTVDLTQAKLNAWFTILYQFVKSVTDAYCQMDGGALQAIHDHVCDRSDGTFLAQLIAWTNRNG